MTRFVVGLLAMAVVTSAAHASEDMTVRVVGLSSPSLWRLTASDPWQASDSLGAFDAPLSGDYAAFDLRAGGVNWFSTHPVSLSAQKRGLLEIYPGAIAGGQQAFSYSAGPSLLLPIYPSAVGVPEPTGAVLLLAGLALIPAARRGNRGKSVAR